MKRDQLEAQLKEKQKRKAELEQYLLKQEMAVERNAKKDPETAKIFLKKLQLAKEDMRLVVSQEKELQVRMEIKKDTKIDKNFM